MVIVNIVILCSIAKPFHLPLHIIQPFYSIDMLLGEPIVSNIKARWHSLSKPINISQVMTPNWKVMRSILLTIDAKTSLHIWLVLLLDTVNTFQKTPTMFVALRLCLWHSVLTPLNMLCDVNNGVSQTG